MSFKVLKYFSNGKMSFFLFASLLRRGLKPKKLMLFFSEISTHTIVGLIEKGLFLSEKIMVCDWNLHILEVNGIYKMMMIQMHA